MQQQPIGNPLPGGWLQRVLAALAAALLIGLGFMFGLVALGLALLLGLVVALRLWWLRRRLRRMAQSRQGNVIEAEYRVVERERERD
jgi:predicted lipid-binding transport protein (Tim44 family)